MRVDTLYSNRGKGKTSLLNQTRDQIEFSASQTRSYFPTIPSSESNNA